MNTQGPGVLLDPADARYLLDAFDALLGDRRPTPQLADFIDRLRRLTAKTGANARKTGAYARDVGTEADSVDYAPYDLVNTREAAAILGITANGVRDLARRGRIPVHRAGGRNLYPAAVIVGRAERRAATRS